MEQSYSESSQNSITYKTLVNLYQQKTIKIGKGDYELNKSFVNFYVQTTSNISATNPLTPVIFRKEYINSFKAHCFIKYDGKLVYSVQDLSNLQYMNHMFQFYNPSNKPQSTYRIERVQQEIKPVGSTGVIDDKMILFQMPLTDFFPFLFSNNKYFRVNDQIEIDIILGSLNCYSTLVLATKTTTNVALEDADDKILELNLEKINYPILQEQICDIRNVILQKEICRQTQKILEIPDQSKMSFLQMIFIQDSTNTTANYGQITEANISQITVFRNDKKLIDASMEDDDIYSQFNTYQIEPTNVLLLPQMTLGQKFDYKIDIKGAADSEISFVIVY